ncbi:MAG: hypothetical protein AB7F43_04730 [Bacteriovoracia bacterium]
MAKPKKEDNLRERRIGKALLLFFKPVKTVLPHQKPFVSQTKITDFPTEFNNQLPKRRPLENAKLFQIAKPPEVRKEIEIPPPRKGASWIELVIYLLAICRRVSSKMKYALGRDEYQEFAQGKNKMSLWARGTIIDQTTSAEFENPIKNRKTKSS